MYGAVYVSNRCIWRRICTDRLVLRVKTSMYGVDDVVKWSLRAPYFKPPITRLRSFFSQGQGIAAGIDLSGWQIWAPRKDGA